MKAIKESKAKTAKKPRPEKPRQAEPSASRGWDRVDEASWESFPASDPPSSWAGKDIKPPTLNGEEEEQGPRAREHNDE